MHQLEKFTGSLGLICFVSIGARGHGRERVKQTVEDEVEWSLALIPTHVSRYSLESVAEVTPNLLRFEAVDAIEDKFLRIVDDLLLPREEIIKQKWLLTNEVDPKQEGTPQD